MMSSPCLRKYENMKIRKYEKENESVILPIALAVSCRIVLLCISSYRPSPIAFRSFSRHFVASFPPLVASLLPFVASLDTS